jgi:hypothetical protein
MSYASITTCTRDTLLQDRVTAAALKESYAGGDEFSKSAFADQLQRNHMLALNYFMWPVAIDNEADYAYALDTNHESPGSADVINDAKLQAGIQAHWPKDAAPMPQPEMFPET